ncbi:MAG: hypothetical protein GY788_29195 [bacterium]|nr:hypothetical protein [bacterium]
MTTAGPAKRLQGDGGATLTEYALLVTLFVAASVLGIQALETGASEEVADQNTCIEKRPPDPSCQIPVLPTTTVTAPDPSPAPTVFVPPTLPTSGAATFDADTVAVDNGDGTWSVEVVVVVQDDGGAVPGVVIEVEFRLAGFLDVFRRTGVTDVNGETRPPIVFNVPFASAASVTATVTDGTPTLTSTPPPTVINNPLP